VLTVALRVTATGYVLKTSLNAISDFLFANDTLGFVDAASLVIRGILIERVHSADVVLETVDLAGTL